MNINIKNALVDELATLDCVKRYLVAGVDENNVPIAKVFTALEKADAVKKFVQDEVKSRLIQKRKEIKKTEAEATVSEDIVIE
jgi:hypothetical protein